MLQRVRIACAAAGHGLLAAAASAVVRGAVVGVMCGLLPGLDGCLLGM